MSEERLNEIKDSVNFQRKLLWAHNVSIVCVDEEQELIEEIDRLNNIINKIKEYLKYQIENLDFEKDTKAKMLGSMILVMLDKEDK